MKKSLNIQSVSDIITNSSSEVFVIKGAGKYQEEVEKFLHEVMRVLGWEGDPAYGFSVTEASQDFSDRYYEYGYKEGDLVIESDSDNSIPYIIMEIIDDLCYIPQFKDKIKYCDISRHHLG